MSNVSMESISKVIVDVGEDLIVEDPDNYQDIRMELNATGHNLTSVLINPRETIIEELLNEFSTVQSAPLAYQSPLSNPSATAAAVAAANSVHSMASSPSTSTQTSSHQLSSHSNHSITYLSSHHSGQSIAAAAAMYTITPAEDLQLERLIIRLYNAFQGYKGLSSIHGSNKCVTGSEQWLNSSTSRFNVLSRSSSTAQGEVHVDNQNVKYKSRQKREHFAQMSHRHKQAEEELRVCYRDVPELFFRPDFSLQSQEIFNKTLSIKEKEHNARVNVTEGVEDITNSTRNSNLNGKLDRRPESLSYYLDLVEVALLRQIWLRSPAFFRALDDIRDLQLQVSDATRQLVEARRRMRQANLHGTERAILIPQQHTRQKNLSVLQDKLLCMQRVVQGRVAIVALLESEDYFSAMELIATTKVAYHEELSGISSMKFIGDQLDDIDNLISEVMCNKFVSIAIQWDQNTVSNGVVEKQNSELQDAIDGEDSMQASLKQLLQSLIRTERTQSALNMYKARLLEAIRLIVRTCVMEYLQHFDVSVAYGDMMDGQGSTEDAQQGDQTPFAQRVKEMGSENFLSCLSMCYEHVLLSINKANVFQNFMHQQLESNITQLETKVLGKDCVTEVGGIAFEGTTANSAESSDKIYSKSNSSAEDIHTAEQHIDTQRNMQSMNKACLAAACDLAQRSISQLINLRKESNSKLPTDKMKFLWEISLNFVLQLEQISGTTAYIIRQCLLAQTKNFLDYLHESCKGRLVVTLDNERWTQCDVAVERQKELDKLSSGKAFLVTTHRSDSKDSLLSGSAKDSMEGKDKFLSSPILKTAENGSSNTTSSSGSANRKRDKEAKPAQIDGVEFKVVWSVLLLAEVVLTYLDVAFNFSPITSDVINKIVELFRLFNNRAKQLVLGAQAIQSAARLKSISAKHLAMTGQSLGLVIALLPHIRAALLAQIPAKHQLLLMELDRISQDYQEHHGQIVSKFVSIVGDFVDSSATRLRQIDWDRWQTDQQQCDYFEDVQRNVIALHRVLQATLPATQVQDVFSRIFALLNRKIPAHFEEIMPSTETGRQRILDEVTHLVSAFSRLKQIDASALTNTLEEAFRKRYIH